jgi:hypothetical protein
MQLKAGTRLRSAADSTEVIAVKAPEGDVDLRCGGRPMVPVEERPAEGASPLAGFDGGTLLGKRYVDPDETLEILCTKAGPGSLSVGETVLAVKEAKPLPSSD